MLLMLSALFIISFAGQSQDTGYKFKDEIRLKTTSVKDQHRSGTCWSFSTLSFIESEMIRLGKKDIPDLSEMFVVRHCYSDKAIKTVRLHGHLNFAGGGAFHDVLYVIKNYGMVPEEVFNGLKIGEEKHVHYEMDQVLKDYVDGVIKNRNKKLSPVWHKGFEGILDAYLGEYPEKFNYAGKEYTPRKFADEIIGINPDDYIELTSYTHHPFYSKFIIEVPDNWIWGEVYNLPIDELMKVCDHALKNGFSIAWGSDVSEKGFSYSKGIAVMPDKTKEDLSDSEQARWEDLSASEKKSLLNNLEAPGKEKTITQEMRQEAFDNYQTTDDHGMHIIGLAKDQNGTKYYIVKNSWDAKNIYDGYFYASESFVKYKTMSILIHKDALPKEIKAKLKL